MWDFHYNFIEKNFDTELLFTDTDSLTYKIKSKNVFEKFFKWKDLFDFSNYSKDSKFFDETKFDKFKDVLVNEKIIRHKIKRIQCKKHKLGTYEINKIYFSCFFDKRYVLDDRIRTLAYFHKDGVTGCKEI